MNIQARRRARIDRIDHAAWVDIGQRVDRRIERDGMACRQARSVESGRSASCNAGRRSGMPRRCSEARAAAKASGCDVIGRLACYAWRLRFFERALLLQPLELHKRVIRKLHRAGNGVVTGPFRDQPVHRLAHSSIRRMPLWRRAEFDDVHGFTRVHVHVEPHAVGHDDRVGGRFVQPRGRHVVRAVQLSAT